MSKSVLGDIAGPFASGQIINLLGLGSSGGDTVNYDAYFEAIESKLDAVQNQLNQLQGGLDTLVTDIAALGQNVTDSAIQRALESFSDKSTIITETFDAYRNALVALASSDQKWRRAGARQLFNLFDTINAQNISVAMREIQDLFLPRLSQQRGLLDYQTQVVTDAINHFASQVGTYSKLAPYQGRLERMEPVMVEVPNNDGVFAFEPMVGKSHELAREILDTAVADTLRAYVKVQFQGMVLLSTAWLGGINERRLASQIDRNKQILAALAKFPETAAQKIDAQIAANLKRYGKRLGPPVATNSGQPFQLFDEKTGFAFGKGFYLNENFIMWKRGKSRMFGGNAAKYNFDLLLMVERPWDYENCRTIGVAWGLKNQSRQWENQELMFYQNEAPTNVPRFGKAAAKNLAFLGQLA